MAKIICTDNFNRDTVSDTLVADNVSEYWGRLIVKFLNANYSSNDSPNFFKLEENDYELYVWEP